MKLNNNMYLDSIRDRIIHLSNHGIGISHKYLNTMEIKEEIYSK